MATKSVQRTTELVSSSASEFIRPQNVKFTASNLKPNVRLYAFFDGENVDHFITSTYVDGSGNLTADSKGVCSGTFSIPAKTYSTGKKQFALLDSATYTDSALIGSTASFVKADFTCTGTIDRFQTTVTTTNVNTVTHVNRVYVPDPIFVPIQTNDSGDPLAQSFFTTGVTGGCFITSVDLYFATTDTSTPALPVWVELREMINGYPGPALLGSNAYSVLPASSVNVSSTATAATNFKFPSPVYLAQDADYCFVVRSNSDKYQIWTSRMSEKSNETGNVVFSQPYSGSLFKSENNKTWTAEQNEDIKFVLYKAAFNNPGSLSPLQLKINANPVSVNCTKFSTIITASGSTVLRASLPYKHALDGNSRVIIAADPLSTYNGLAGSAFSNVVCTVNSIIDEYTVDINVVGSSATSTGVITTGGRLKDILIDFGGTGYSVAPTISISAPSAGGTQATAVATVTNGVITDIKVTNPGTKYTSAPTITVSSGGATFTAVMDEQFTVSTNRQYHRLNPSISATIPPGTKVSGQLTSTTRTNYTAGKTYPVNLTKETVFDDHLMLVSRTNESAILAGSASTNLQLTFASANGTWNPNVSPVIDFDHSRATFIGNVINSQTAIGTSETEIDTSGTVHLAHSRYITKRQSLAQTAKGMRVLVTGYSNGSSGFDVYARTSNSGSSTLHESLGWVALNCDTKRNRSSKPGEMIEYEFYLDNITEFDTLTLKLVLYTDTRYDPPVISDYRAIMLG